jgi:hypothetical protein
VGNDGIEGWLVGSLVGGGLSLSIRTDNAPKHVPRKKAKPKPILQHSRSNSIPFPAFFALPQSLDGFDQALICE